MNIDDFNTLDLKKLVKLPGIGNNTANRLISYRSKYTIKSAKDLLKIKGIGVNTLKKLGIELPAREKKKTKQQQLVELTEYISSFSLTPKTPFNELSYNTRIAFYEDLVKDTCQRPDLVRSSTGCNECPYALLCKCHLRNFVSDRNKRNATPSKTMVKALLDQINKFYHYRQTNGEVLLSKLNIPLYD
jgi:hypothetical protein